MIKRFATAAEYAVATKSDSETQLSLVKEGNDVRLDGVNVRTLEPAPYDACFVDGNKRTVYIKGGTLAKALIPADWQYVGPVFGRVGNKAAVLWNAFSSTKYTDVVQFKVTVPSATGTISLGAQFVTAGTTTVVSVEYEADMPLATAANTYEANDTTLCGRINTALAGLEGITGTWWAYQNGDGDVILQRDTWTDYRQYTCSGALTHVTWGDMPATSANILKADGKTTQSRGVMNAEGAVAHWSTYGRTPTSNVAAHISGSDNPVSRNAFVSSEYCAALREEYGTYELYIEKCFEIEYPQRFSCFGEKFDAAMLTAKYGPMTAPVKGGGTKAKFPALHWPLTVGIEGADGCAPGQMYLWGAHEGMRLMPTSCMNGVNAIQKKMGKTTLANSAARWFAQGYNVYRAWLFNGNNRMLSTNYVNNGLQVGAVALMGIENKN